MAGFWKTFMAAYRKGAEEAKAKSAATAAAQPRRKSRAEIELAELHSMPPVLTGWPTGLECKKMERTKEGWQVRWGRVGKPHSDGLSNIYPNTVSFSVPGGMVQVNGKM